MPSWWYVISSKWTFIVNIDCINAYVIDIFIRILPKNTFIGFKDNSQCSICSRIIQRILPDNCPWSYRVIYHFYDFHIWYRLNHILDIFICTEFLYGQPYDLCIRRCTLNANFVFTRRNIHTAISTSTVNIDGWRCFWCVCHFYNMVSLKHKSDCTTRNRIA